jgi:regulator of RNase E activity RraA
VIDWRGYLGAGACGAGSMVVPVSNGLAGIVTDGAFRDVEELRALNLPVFARAVNPTSPPKAQVGEINVPVSCGGVVIEPGDIIVGSAEGIAVVPRAHAARVAGKLAAYQRPNSLAEWPIEERRRKAQVRAEQYRTLADERFAKTVG